MVKIDVFFLCACLMILNSFFTNTKAIYCSNQLKNLSLILSDQIEQIKLNY